MTYKKQQWKTGEIITEGKLNHIEDGIYSNDKNLTESKTLFASNILDLQTNKANQSDVVSINQEIDNISADLAAAEVDITTKAAQADVDTISDTVDTLQMQVTTNTNNIKSLQDNAVNKSELDTKQDKLTAGNNITIVDNVISATTSGGDVPEVTGTKPIVVTNNNISLSIGDGLVVSDSKLTADFSSINNQLNNKVDKVTGKSLIADTEITRLADVHNYDDTDVKASISNLESTKQDKLTAGSNITIENNIISATDTKYELPTASSTTLGGIKIGDNLSISEDGTLSASGGSSTPDNMVTTDTDQTITGSKTINQLIIPQTLIEKGIFIEGQSSPSIYAYGNKLRLATVGSIVTENLSATGLGENIVFGAWDNSNGSYEIKCRGKAKTGSTYADTIFSFDIMNRISYFGNSQNITIINGSRVLNSSNNIFLTQSNVTAGDNISIENTTDGIKISSTGGSGEPSGTSVYSFGMSQYYKGTMNNPSWLRSAGQWNSGTVYTGLYNWAVEQQVAGVDGFKLSTEEYSDYDWVINTEEQTLRLPLLAERILVESKVDGTQGYNLYSDGWCEQWGRVPYGANEDYTVNLLKTMANTDYNCQVTLFSGTTPYRDSISGQHYQAWNLSTTSFVTHRFSSASIAQMWKVSGYTDTSTSSSYNLYYYVGDTLQNADLINIAKLLEDIANIKSNGNFITVPGTTYQELSIPTAGVWYKSPGNGYMIARFMSSANNQFCQLGVNSTGRGSLDDDSDYNNVLFSTGANNGMSIALLISEDHYWACNWNFGQGCKYVRFIPLINK